MSRHYNTIKVKELRDGVVLIQLNRPKKLNSLSEQLTTELLTELQRLDSEPLKYGCAIITGNSKVFCAGADISELYRKGGANTNGQNQSSPIQWATALPHIQIPIIAAVDGFCLGGGCELAMICDIIYSTKQAKFGQPEIKIGVIPGGGGTQRLSKAMGKSRAMELIMTGEPFTAQEAFDSGLVSRLFDDNEKLLQGAIDTALKISRGPRKAVVAAKQAVLAGYNKGLDDGAEFERDSFIGLFSTYDKKEGMTAFLKRRPPVFEWRNKGMKL
ncbi:hypothetical protein DASC09_001350 [Saccharomycopsis crataegensis]|uniref:Enoyl-CoA hydratase n=1 Tax=Saccharomycopsis crataegensis TaxID=43959 RepID=A0AAV5QEG3_9ASCO|nr:hypothetical protein DASC09_001350 [Saccharomycopsis crataegensis]